MFERTSAGYRGGREIRLEIFRIIAHEQIAMVVGNRKAVAAARFVPGETSRFVLVAAVNPGADELQCEKDRLHFIHAVDRARFRSARPIDLAFASHAGLVARGREDADREIDHAAFAAQFQNASGDEHGGILLGSQIVGIWKCLNLFQLANQAFNAIGNHLLAPRTSETNFTL